ncbi:MAG: hypothetical protein Q8R36_01640 [bacterium]|nr:hypothetical protein [bacterium]
MKYVLPLLAISLLGCGEPTAQSYFRAQFNNNVIENQINKFPYWDEIQTKEVDMALKSYLKEPYAQKKFPKEAEMVFRLIDQGGLLGVATEAHEKWEVLEYLKKGYSLEDISNGKAHKENRSSAHAVARYKELRFYQFWYTQLFGSNPPAMRTFLFVHPALKIFIEDIYKTETTTKIMEKLTRELKEYESVARAEKSSKDDVLRCIEFFERTGYNYGAERSLFLNRGLTFFEEIK